jgi:hypothetical protein
MLLGWTIELIEADDNGSSCPSFNEPGPILHRVKFGTVYLQAPLFTINEYVV